MAVFSLTASQIGCERLWKKFTANTTKKRGKLAVSRSADQVFLKCLREIAKRFGLAELVPEALK